MEKMYPHSRAVVVTSGGQDSTTCLYWALKNFAEVHAISFFYGQKHHIETSCASKLCRIEEVPFKLVDVSFLPTIVESALTNHDADLSIKNGKGLPNSFVPNRNQLFLTLAHSYAQKINANHLVTGVCQTDYSGYPDCRQAFITGIEMVTNLGSGSDIRIHAPLMYLTKAETFEMAAELGILDRVLEYSHTCYNGDRTKRHQWGYGCGTCDACKLREKGFEEYKRSQLLS